VAGHTKDFVVIDVFHADSRRICCQITNNAAHCKAYARAVICSVFIPLNRRCRVGTALAVESVRTLWAWAGRKPGTPGRKVAPGARVSREQGNRVLARPLFLPGVRS